jgi:hypothetical protein
MSNLKNAGCVGRYMGITVIWNEPSSQNIVCCISVGTFSAYTTVYLYS